MILLFTLTQFLLPFDKTWYTIRTQHFVIHYYSGEEYFAKRLAIIAERVHKRLSEFLDYSTRTQIILTDNYDSPNGIATVIPRNTVVIYLTQPRGVEFIVNYDDWLEYVFTHEYTHVLQMDMVHGGYKILRKIFGKVIVPGGILPTWLIEGIAVYDETKFTKGGRLNHSIFNMVIRKSVEKNTFPNINKIEVLTPTWPLDAPYVYGADFVGYLIARFGKEKLVQFFKTYTTLWFYGLNTPVEAISKKVFGNSFSTLWLEYQIERTSYYRQEIEYIYSKGLTPCENITQDGYYSFTPVFSPCGSKLAFVKSTPHDLNKIMLYDLRAKKLKTLYRGYVLPGIDFSKDGRYIVFSALDIKAVSYTHLTLPTKA